LALGLLAPVVAIMGFAKGVTSPSRDLLVRAATPPGASGKVFGFVYCGLDVGALAMPPVYGWLMDRGEPRMVLIVAAGLMVLTTFTVLEVRRRGLAAHASAWVPAGRRLRLAWWWLRPAESWRGCPSCSTRCCQPG